VFSLRSSWGEVLLHVGVWGEFFSDSGHAHSERVNLLVLGHVLSLLVLEELHLSLVLSFVVLLGDRVFFLVFLLRENRDVDLTCYGGSHVRGRLGCNLLRINACVFNDCGCHHLLHE